MSRPIDADALEKDGWRINRNVQINKQTMEFQTRKPTDFPAIEPEPEQRWIPCSEAVPATEDKVLCQTVTKKGVVNFVIGYHTEKFGWACGMNSNVVAWMPLPEPYKEDTDE